MGELSRSIGQGIGSLVSRTAEVAGSVIDWIVRTANTVLPGSAVLVVVAAVIAVLVVLAARRP